MAKADVRISFSRYNILLIFLCFWSFSGFSEEAVDACYSIDYSNQNQYGPIDYYLPANHQLGAAGRSKETAVTLVTNYHMTSNVVNLIKGDHGAIIEGDLDYTLRAVPNHPMALNTASRFEKRRKTSPTFAEKQRALPVSADCYFERALRVFGTRQAQTWMLWGIHRFRLGQYDKALENYKKAQELGLDSAELDYNMGLAYLKVEQIEQAQKYADKAYAKGYPLPGLKLLLENAQKSQNNADSTSANPTK